MLNKKELDSLLKKIDEERVEIEKMLLINASAIAEITEQLKAFELPSEEVMQAIEEEQKKE